MSRQVITGAGAATMNSPWLVPQVGDRYVWEVPDVFGPIYLRVERVIHGRKPRVVFVVQGADEHHYHRTCPLPLSPSMRREDWT